MLGINQLNAQTKWTLKNPFEQKNFIENKGQFDVNKIPNAEPVLFVAKIDGVQYYFTKSGYTIGRNEKVKKTEKEMEETEKKPFETKNEKEEAEEKEKESKFKIVELFHELKFANTNDKVEILAENKVNNYYSYSDLKSKDKKGTITANAFTRLIYKNIYPNTDVVFEFPKDSTGIEYSIYLHPGADVAKIKMFFPGNTRFKLKKNNIVVTTKFGKIIDHQPFSYRADNKSFVKSKFKITGDQIGFEIENNDANKTIIIDPWTVTPNFSGYSGAYDVDYDNLGNVYVYGGNTGGPFILLKYDPAGTLIWTYTPSLFSSYYGDFAVDKNSNSIYLVEGFNYSSGAQAIKINPNATVLATYPGNSQYAEMWRIAFSRCSNQAVIAGGGTSNPTYQTCFLDSNLVNLSLVQYIPSTNCCHDVGLLALDNYGNCYQETNLPAGFPDGLFENQLVKLPLPSLFPVTYNVNTDYAFVEASSVMYYDLSGYSPANGYNGLTTSNTIVYSYDSYVLKKWDGPTGNLLVYKRINYPNYGDSSKIYWGGISADDCGNLFLADSNVVLQYDTTLTLINSYTMPDVITDINWSNNGLLYVCGLGFASSLTPTGTISCFSGGTMSLSTTSTDATCTTTGSATAVISGGSPPYNIVWNTSPPQYGNSISNIPPGTYTVTVSEGSCLQQTIIDTVTILAGPGAFSSTATVTTGCAGSSNDGAITVTTLGGASPFTYTWSNGLPNSSSVTGLAPGTYSLTITDDGSCTNTYLALVVGLPTTINYSFTGSVNCFNDTTSLHIIPTGGSAPYNVNWTNPIATGATLHGITAGTYIGTVTDAGGCEQAFNYNLTQPQLLSATSAATYNCAVLNSGSIVVTPSGGNNSYSYSWTGYPSNTTNTLSGIGSGIYTVTVTDTNQCNTTIVDTIETYSPLLISGAITQSCNNGTNGSIVTTVNGGTVSTYQYNWTGFPGNTTNTLNNLAAGTYTLSVTSGSCTATSVFTVPEAAIIDTLNLQTTYCEGEALTLLSLSGTDIGIAQSPYQWYDLGISIPGANQNNYNATINILNNYSFTWYYGGCMYSTSGVDSTVYLQFNGSTLPNVFSPNNDGINDLFFPMVELANSVKIYYFEKYNLKIFDRWGKKVFETDDFTKGWDGNNLKSKKSDTGVYFWIVTGKTNCSDKTIEYKGFVDLDK